MVPTRWKRLSATFRTLRLMQRPSASPNVRKEKYHGAGVDHSQCLLFAAFKARLNPQGLVPIRRIQGSLTGEGVAIFVRFKFEVIAPCFSVDRHHWKQLLLKRHDYSGDQTERCTPATIHCCFCNDDVSSVLFPQKHQVERIMI